ncbi:MAG: 30S ribosomal protein S3 [Chloroflexi bacterium]|nr:30S ribosomal protein S3 [Chloroflexota bacterium]
MGHKTHPIGFRLGIIKDWQARWYAEPRAAYRDTLLEDLRIRHAIMHRYPDAGISRVEIERNTQEVTVTVHTARPGIVIGRQGQRVEELRQSLEALTKGRLRITVQEVQKPEMDAVLVARNVAEQLERRVSHRRAMLQTASRSMQAGAKGVKIVCGGRLGGAEIARREKVMMGRVPLHTLRADIDFAVGEARTAMGRIGIKVWIYRGDIMPAGYDVEPAAEELKPIQVTVRAEEQEEGEHASAETS